MPLLRKEKDTNGESWVVANEQEELPSLVSLQRYLEILEADSPLPTGVCLAPTDDTSLLAPHLDKLSLIAIDFPAYTDGRGYSHARHLRKRLGYTGKLKAIGDIREDQVLFMCRLGFDMFMFQNQPNMNLLDDIVKRYKTSYQPSYG